MPLSHKAEKLPTRPVNILSNTEVSDYLPYSSFFNTRALKAGHVILEEGQFVDSLTLYKCQFGGKISLIDLTG